MNLKQIKYEIEKNTPGLNKNLNRSTSIRMNNESSLDINERINDFRRQKIKNIKKIEEKMNEVKLLNNIIGSRNNI